jgi:hypothetical protein
MATSLTISRGRIAAMDFVVWRLKPQWRSPRLIMFGNGKFREENFGNCEGGKLPLGDQESIIYIKT